MEAIKKLLDKYKTMPMERREFFLKFFRNIPAAVSKQVILMEVKKGQHILEAGAPCDAVYFLLKGKVSGEVYTSRGKASSFMDFSQMWILGDFELFNDYAEYCVAIVAEQNCALLKLAKDTYKSWIRNDANALYLRIQNILSVLTFERRIDREYMQKNSKERLILLLVRFYETGVKDKNGLHTVQYTQGELADKIGVNLRSVQRSISALEIEQLVQLKKGKMVISCEQYEKLLELAGE